MSIFNQFGTQNNARTAAADNGNRIIVYSNDFGPAPTLQFALHDGFGAQITDPIVITPGTEIPVQVYDVVATSNGRFTVMWGDGSSAFIQSFDATTGAATGSRIDLPQIGAFEISGGQMLAIGSNSIRVVLSRTDVPDDNTNHSKLRISTTGTITEAESTIFNTTAGTVSDLVQGNGTSNYALVTAGVTTSIVHTFNGSSVSFGSTNSRIVKLQENVHLVVSDRIEASGGRVDLRLLTGFGSDLTTYTLSTPIQTQFLSGAGTGSAGTGGRVVDVLALGDGRAAVFYTGDVQGVTGDGLYRVLVTPQGVFTPVKIAGIGGVGDFDGAAHVAALAALGGSAALLPDGRTDFVYSNPSTMFGFPAGRNLVLSDTDLRSSDGRTITGTSRADAFFGTLSGSDLFTDIAPGDRVNGGGGNNTVRLAAGIAREIDLQDPDRFDVPSGLASINNIEAGGLADLIYGNSGSNHLSGGGGDDTLYGRLGNDTIRGEDGNDVLHAGSGNDLAFGGAGDDLMFGFTGDDRLYGDAGTDTIYGGDGADQVFGGADNDQLYGLAGDDEVFGGSGSDAIFGGSGDDTVYGGSGDDTINTGGGDDLVFGGSGNDLIIMRSGSNVVDGGSGIDTVSYAGFALPILTSGRIIDLLGGTEVNGLFGGDEGVFDSYTSIENVIGTTGSDYIAGTDGANMLSGRSGDDTIMGRGGSDTMTGGSGADMFLFDRVLGGLNVITDFEVGTDSIGFFAGLLGDIHAGNLAERFVKTANGFATGASQAQLILQMEGATPGRLRFDPDGPGGTASTTIATLTFATPDGLASFSAGDILFI